MQMCQRQNWLWIDPRIVIILILRNLCSCHCDSESFSENIVAKMRQRETSCVWQYHCKKKKNIIDLLRFPITSFWFHQTLWINSCFTQEQTKPCVSSCHRREWFFSFFHFKLFFNPCSEGEKPKSSISLTHRQIGWFLNGHFAHSKVWLHCVLQVVQ